MIPRRAVGQSLEGLTPRRVRELVEAEVGPALERWIARLGYTHTGVAAALDVERQTLDQYLRGPSAKRGARLTMGVLYTLPLPVRALVAQDLVGDDFTIVELPRPEAARRGRRWLTRMLRAGTEALTRAVDDGDDGSFCRAEAVALLPLAEAHLREVVQLVELLREAERTGVATLERDTPRAVAAEAAE